MNAYSPTEAERLWKAGRLPDQAQVAGPLTLDAGHQAATLPAGLCTPQLTLLNWSQLRTLPPGLRVRDLRVAGCVRLEELPDNLECFALNATDTALRTLPAALKVQFRLDLTDCHALAALPEGFKTGTLVLRNCTRLRELPEGLAVAFLDISGCTQLRQLPECGTVGPGQLLARNCFELRTLPDWLGPLAQLDLAGCANLTTLPAGLTVQSWIDVADTGLHTLPAPLHNTQLHWRGVQIDARIAFDPTTITAAEVLDEPNQERRRVMLERMGYERFLEGAHAEQLDCDQDAGGERRLLRLAIAGDEPLVCLMVQCPSTGRRYALRVPPTLRSCHQAAAWIAGFDDPWLYQPLQET